MSEDLRAGYAMGFEAGVAYQKSKSKGKAWNGAVACGVPIKRMSHHPDNNPTCRMPCADGHDACWRHLKLAKPYLRGK